jgi:hypothetical protein
MTIHHECVVACDKGYLRDEKTGKCKQDIIGLVFSIVGYAVSGFSALTLLYKGFVFFNLKREGRLNPEMMSTKLGAVKVFMTVVAYGENGKHIVDNTMEAALLGGGENTTPTAGSTTTMEDGGEGIRRGSFVEMRDRSGLRNEAAVTAWLDEINTTYASKYATLLFRQGLDNLEDISELENVQELIDLGVKILHAEKIFKAAKKIDA